MLQAACPIGQAADSPAAEMQLRQRTADKRQAAAPRGDLSMIAALIVTDDPRRNSVLVPDCPLAPPSRRTTYVRAFHRACMILGGVAQLAAQLELSEAAVRTWLDGREEPPENAFLSVVEIVLLDSAAGRRRNT